ncbi:MAG: hypothetical protein V4725_17885 [Bacteroidota bacterium]
MEEFLKHDLEPLSYLVYCLAVFTMLKKQKPSRRIVLFLYYLLASVIIAIACHSVDEINRILYNTFFFMTICVLSFYYRDLVLSAMKKKVILGLFVLNLALFVNQSVVANQLIEINNYSYAITYLTIVVYALLFFHQVMTNVTEANILHQFDFWLASGYLMYFVGCFFIILFYDNVEVKHRAVLWSVQNIILLFSSMLTLFGALWIRYQVKYY